MNRTEELNEYIRKIVANENIKSDTELGINIGVAWADAHPSLARFWHEVGEEPEKGSLIFAKSTLWGWETYDYDPTFYDDPWNVKVKLNQFEGWIYLNDIIKALGYDN